MIIRAKTFEAWMKRNLDRGQLRDLSEHGAQSGWPGLTYYTDTCKLYARFKDEIWEWLLEDAESFGQTVFQLIDSFGGSKDVGSCHQFENLVVWYAAERVARAVTDA